MAKLIDLFPTALWMDNIGCSLDDEIKCLGEFDRRSLPGNWGSLDMNVLDRFPTIARYITRSLDEYEKTVIGSTAGLYFTQSWLNFSDHGEYHHKHFHPNSILSGVFYLSANSMYDTIRFYRRDMPYLLDFNPKNQNIYNCDTQTIAVKTGDLLLFPSHLEHSVDPNPSNKTRISLAFNTFASGSIGDRLGAAGLDL